jgi:phosphoesterase RecJ-like protein
MGKSATVWSRDPVPGIYQALPGSDRIHVGEEPPAGFPDTYTHAIILECPTLDRTGLEDRLKALPLINIDHHLGNALYGKVNWVDTAAPSLGEMLFRLARDGSIEVDAQTATCLYLTLVTDTGGFRFSNTNALAFDAAAALVRQGASPVQVGAWIYENQPEGSVRLLGEMLQTLELHEGGRIATAQLSRAMFERAGAAPGDSEGLIDHPRSIAGVEAVALFREVGDDEYKVSLRSRHGLNVEAVATAHGGGGHPNAAGCSLQGELATVQETILAALQGALNATETG